MLEEVNDYKLYPIADNETPQLSADRFEYNFSSGMIFNRVWELNDIRECYNNVTILKNEDGIIELGFKDLTVGEKYISTVSKLWPSWITNPDKAVMQFLADMLKAMHEGGYITIDDLYTLSEQEVIDKIRSCENKYLSETFDKFQKAKIVYDSENPIKDKYCVSINAKRRYIVPLVQHNKNAIRINIVSEKAKEDIDTYLNFKTAKWAYFDFDFDLNTKSNILVKKIK